MKLAIPIFAILLSACSLVETIPASVLECEAAMIAKAEAGLKFDGTCFGAYALAEATKAE